jgi:hypothetical protein
MSPATAQPLAARATPGRFECERIGQFESRRQKPGLQDGVQCPHRISHVRKADGQIGSEGRQRQQLQGRLRDHAQQTFRPHKQPVQIKAGLVLGGPTAQPHDGSISQHHLQSEHVIPRDPVLEAARAAGIGDDVAADGIVGTAGRVGRIEQSALFHLRLQVRRDDACLNHRHKIARMDFVDAIHADQ